MKIASDQGPCIYTVRTIIDSASFATNFSTTKPCHKLDLQLKLNIDSHTDHRFKGLKKLQFRAMFNVLSQIQE
ncbi:MAG: hypothetical protein OCD01_04265 [Fibrobacterales bacterium]